MSLSPKAFELLDILVENHPKALSKTELQARLWPGTYVVEKNLTNLVSEIRAALDDDPLHPRFIRTVHRFGYAFREATATESRASDVSACTPGARTAALDAPRHNLPVPLTNFIGRDRELAELRRLVASTRLLTLTGAGGCGKTRLALELAANVLDVFPTAYGWSTLRRSPIRTWWHRPWHQCSTFEKGPTDPSAKRSRTTSQPAGLLVLDNCEHLIAACAQLAEELLRTALRLRILATSREGLGITGETLWRVPSLSVPDRLRPLPQSRCSGRRGEVVCRARRRFDPAFT